MNNKNRFSIIALVLVAGFFVLGTAHALTMDEIVAYQQQPVQPQPQVLGNKTYSGDFNGDGVVNSLDIAIMQNNLGQNFPEADLNDDGVVNVLDFSLMKPKWFKKLAQ